MNTKLLLLGFLSAIVIIGSTSFFNSGGSHGAKTGSPADGNNCTQCHSGTPTTVNSWISTDIPASGYVAGQTYTITLEGTHSNVARFGFELTAEGSANAKLGTFVVTNATQTKLVNSNHAITHTGNGFTPDNDSSKTWTFDWIAPASGSGNVKFYAALLAANGNMSTSGDITYLTTLEVAEDVASGIANNNEDNGISIYPTIVENVLTINIENTRVNSVSIYNVNGQLIMRNDINDINTSRKLELNNLSKGVYIAIIDTDKGQVNKRFIKR